MGLIRRKPLPQLLEVEDIRSTEVNDLILAPDTQLGEQDEQPMVSKKNIDIDDFWNNWCIW